MTTTYEISTSEIDNNFINSIKSNYIDKNLRIQIEEIDETEYLLKSSENKKILFEGIAELENSNGTKILDFEELNQLVNEKN